MTEPRPLFRTIVAATANVRHLDAPVLTAAHLAIQQSARLRIFHAIPFWDVFEPKRPTASHPAPRFHTIENRSRDASASLLALYSRHYPGLTGDDVVISTGVAWESLFRAALDLKGDLVVVGPHEAVEESLKIEGVRGFLGSTADGVIRQAWCPVMIANRGFNQQRLEMKKIVVGVDFSPSCIGAICLAAIVARHNDSFVSTFHMLPIAPYPKYTPQALQADRIRRQQHMNAVCVRLLNGIVHQYFVKPGARPHEELLRFANQTDADLIIMGSHTREKSGKWYSGSVVQQVACRSECPVIVVNGAQALTPWKDSLADPDGLSKTAADLSQIPF